MITTYIVATSRRILMYQPSKRLESAHRDPIWSVHWSPGGEVLTGSLDGTVKCWNGDLDSVGISKPEVMGITSVVSFNEGSTAIMCSQDGNIRVLKIPTLERIGSIEAGLQEAWTVCLSPSNDVIASGNHKGAVTMWSVDSCERALSVETNSGFILNLAFSPDGLQLSTVGTDGLLNIIDIATQSVVQRIDAHSLPSRCVKYYPDGDLVFTASDDRHVAVFDTRSGTPINSFSHAGMALSVDVSPDLKHFAVGCSNHTVAIWDIGMQRMFQSLNAQHTDPVWSVSYSLDGHQLASVGDDSLLQLYQCQ